MGGIGKSQLATEFAYSRAPSYDLVYWIDSEEPATIADQFADLVERLGLTPGRNAAGLQAQVHGRLQETPGWLLIFDNADAVKDIRPWIPGGLLKPGLPGHVIVTTRRAGFAALGSVMDLDVLDLVACKELLRSRVPGIASGTARAIASELGRLPLALEQAAAYLEQNSMPAGEYLGLLRQRGEELISRGKVAGREDTIATLWDIALERISEESPAAVELLDLCAWLAPDPIPLDLFTEHAALLDEPLASAADDPLAFAEAIGILADYSLARRVENGLQLHRLVQGAVRAQCSSPETRLGTVLALLHADAPSTIVGTPEDWPRWAVLLPHVLAATSHCDRVPGQVLDDAQADQSWLLYRTASYLRVRARFTEAQPLAERALAIAKATYGPNHPIIAAALNNLANVLQDLGQLADAQSLTERALAITEATYGPNHPDVAVALNNLVNVLQDLEQPEKALPLAERALAIAKATYGPNHPTIAIRLNNLALTLQYLEQPEKALPLAERALVIAEATYGPNHPTTAAHLTNLATLLQDLEQPEKALPLAERAVTIDEAAYGPDHPEVGIDLNNLAAILRDLGEDDAADRLWEIREARIASWRRQQKPEGDTHDGS